MIFRVWKCHQMSSPLQPLLLYPLRLHITLPCSTQEGESKNAVWLNYYQLSHFERVRPLCRLFVDWETRRVLCKTMLEVFWSVGKFANYKPLQIAVIKLERKWTPAVSFPEGVNVSSSTAHRTPTGNSNIFFLEGKKLENLGELLEKGREPLKNSSHKWRQAPQGTWAAALGDVRSYFCIIFSNPIVNFIDLIMRCLVPVQKFDW